MESIKLQKLTEDYLEYARMLRNENAQYFVYNEQIEPEEHLKWYANILQNNNYSFYIIKENNEPVGTISALTHENGEIELGNIIIEKSHRGRGLLAETLQKLLLMLPPETVVFVSVLVDNKVALAAYENLGFKYSDQNQNIVKMTLWNL